MAMTTNTPLTDSLVHQLRLAGVVPADRYLEAMDMARDGEIWRLWGRRILLGLAAGQLLASAIFFFAFNWQAVPGLVKIAITLGATVLCAVAALAAGRTVVRQTLLVAASLMTGAVLAVFGQHYQTGADTWEMFATWAVAILPWTALAGGAAAWLVWGVVTQTALALADTTLRLNLHPAFYLSVPAAFFLAREILPDRTARWLALIALVQALGVLVWHAGQEMTGGSDRMIWASPALAVTGMLAWAASWRKRRDLAPLALSACAICVTISWVLIHHARGIPATLAAMMAAALMFALAVSALNRLKRRQA